MLGLVGDIGGTNTRLALAKDSTLMPESVARFANAEFASLESVIRHYLATQDNPDCDRACVALAGPVQDGVGRMTNLDWQIDRKTLAAAAKAERAEVINDLQAQGYAIGYHAKGSLKTVLTGEKAGHKAAELVIGVGTGNNIAAVFHTPSGRVVPPAEAGHVSLPVRTAEEADFARFLEARFGFASVEEALSGRGLEHLYEWASGGAKLTGREIIARASAKDEAAVRAVETFVRLLASVAGNLALTLLPFGGIYLIGGMSLACAPWFNSAGFGAAFADKGRFSTFLQQFPVYIVQDDMAALAGAASILPEI